MMDLPLAFDLMVAALVGLAIGTEREWSGHSAGPDGRFAGLRTFCLLGALGGFAGWFYRDGSQLPAIAILGAALAFPVVAYASTMRRAGTTADGTTEVAAMLAVVLGFAAGLGHRAVAGAATSLVVLLLAEKSKLRSMLQRVDDVEMRAALQFAVLALVVLPVLPGGSYGPYDAFRPRMLWTVVLVFSALNFVGYIVRRIVGESRGPVITGLLGGVLSSTVVALNFSRRSREHAEQASPLSLGVIAACTVLPVRIGIVCSVLQPAVALAALPSLAPPVVAGAIMIARSLWQERAASATGAVGAGVMGAGDTGAGDMGAGDTGAGEEPMHNPLGLGSSLQMAVAFQAVLFVIAFMQERIGNPGVLASATLLGLTDMDALTVSMTRLGADPSLVSLAARAIGIGVLSNTALKTGLALAIGASGFRSRVLAGLGVLGAATAIGLLLAWR